MDGSGEDADCCGKPRGWHQHIGCGAPFGVARGLLTVWRRQLSSTDASQKPRQGFAAVRIDAETSAPEDSGTSLEPDTVATALPVVRTRGRIEIDIAGARIRVETGVDHATLAMVLAAVRGDR